MLTFVLTTADEGRDLELFLSALGQAMGPQDAVLVFHTGDGRTLTRLQAFAERHQTRIIQTDSTIERGGELLRLGLQEARTDYTLVLSPTDRLQSEALAGLRQRLDQEAPDLCLMHSAWWLAEADHPLPRSDSALFETLPPRPDAAACAGLLPDPRRLIWRSADWAGRATIWPTQLEGQALFARALTESTGLIAAPAPILLHRLHPTDPGPALAECTQALTACAKGDRAAALADWAPLLDEHLSLCPPAEAPALLAALPQIAALLPRRARSEIARLPGPFARLLTAQITQGALGAKVELGLQLSLQQQHRSDVLAAAYGRLRQDVDLALPGPEYLRDLYTRLRGL